MGTWELTSAPLPACPCPRGCGSFLLGLPGLFRLRPRRRAGTAQGPDPPGTRTQVLLELGGGHALGGEWGWGWVRVDLAPLWSPLIRRHPMFALLSGG